VIAEKVLANSLAAIEFKLSILLSNVAQHISILLCVVISKPETF